MSLRIKIIFSFFLIIFCLFGINSENWVGKAATFQLIEGTKLADGSSFNKEDFIAACNGFKIGAEVNIINPANGKSITVVIKDRVDNEKEYFIMLSQKAAQAIELEWDTALVIVEGKFSDINSTERLDINGLVKEGEIDPESLKRFPEINWPKDEKTTTAKVDGKIEDSNTPPVDKKETPYKKEELAKIDIDDKNGYKVEQEKQYQEIPKEAETKTPEGKMKKFMISTDTDNGEAKIEQEKTVIAKTDEKKDIENKIQTDKKEEPKKTINWDKKLKKGNIYIRITTAFDKKEGERRYYLFSMIFPNIIGIEENNKYILFVGPIDKEKIDTSLNKIRSYGFKDAYIVKGK